MSILLKQIIVSQDLHDVIHSALEEETWISEVRRTALCKKLRSRIALHQTGEGTTRTEPLVVNMSEAQADLDFERDNI